MRIFEVNLKGSRLVDLKKKRNMPVRHSQGERSIAATLGLPRLLGLAGKDITAGIASHFRFGSSIRIRSNGKYELEVGQRNFDLDGWYYYNRFR